MISISVDKYANLYRLTSRQFINQSLETVWNYFSSPSNLQELTPKDLDFQIVSPLEPKMYLGQIIVYKIGIFPFFRTTWVTEITQLEKQFCFIDEQRFGPYTLWHHRHTFVETEKGVIMTDEVHFKLPFGIVGRLFYPLIKKKLLKIFKFRFERVEKLFNSKHENK